MTQCYKLSLDEVNQAQDLREIHLNGLGLRLARCCLMMATLFAMALLVAGILLMIPSLRGKFSYGLTPQIFGVFAFGSVVLFVFLVFEYLSKIRMLVHHEAILLVLFCLVVHLLCIRILPVFVHVEGSMTYDPSLVLKSMESGRICFLHDARNQGWCNYEILMSLLAVVFNGKLELGRIIQAVFCVLPLAPLYFITKEIMGQRVARFAVLVQGLSPTILMYSMILTSEFISSMFMFASAYFLIQSFRAHAKGTDIVLPLCLSGVMLGISDLFKVIAIVFLAAILAIAVVGCFTNGRRLLLKWVGLLLLVFYPSFLISRHVGQESLNALVSAPQLSTSIVDSSPLLYELALGLNVENEGFYSKKVADGFLAMTQNEKSDYVRTMVRRDWKRYPRLMACKFRNIHGSNCYHHGAVSTFTSVFKDKKGVLHIPRWVRPLADSGTMFFKILFLAGTLGLLFTVRRHMLFWMPGVLSIFVILGFAVIEQLIEGHGRYKTAIYPFYFMVVPYACVWFKRDNLVCVRISELARRILGRLKVYGSRVFRAEQEMAE